MIVEVVGAVIRDTAGRVLTVRKRGTARFMLPGGKREPGEDDLAALARELREELLGCFEASAANEPGATVRSSAYCVETVGELAIAAEIEEYLWLDPSAPPDVPVAPLLAGQVLPALSGAPTARPSGSD